MNTHRTPKQEPAPVYEKPKVTDYGDIREITAAHTLLRLNTDVPRHGSTSNTFS
jgi:hypothetical protein